MDRLDQVHVYVLGILARDAVHRLFFGENAVRDFYARLDSVLILPVVTEESDVAVIESVIVVIPSVDVERQCIGMGFLLVTPVGLRNREDVELTVFPSANSPAIEIPRY